MLFRELFSHVSPYLDTYVLRLIDLNRCFFAMHNGMPLFGYVLRLIDLNRFFLQCIIEIKVVLFTTVMNLVLLIHVKNLRRINNLEI